MRTRLGLKLLGLSALVMGAMTIGTAGVAQAETGACWGYVNAKAELKCFGEAGLESGASFKFTSNTVTFLVANLNFEVLCTGGESIEGGKLTSNGSITAGRIKFVGCIGLSKTPTLTKLAACTPKDPIFGAGTIVTEKATGLIVLHVVKNEKKEIILQDSTVLLKPVVGEVLKKLHFSEECSVGEELIVKGELVLSDNGGKGSFEEHKLTHTFTEFAALQLMKVGVNKATVEGSVVFSLTSPHNALKWAGKAI